MNSLKQIIILTVALILCINVYSQKNTVKIEEPEPCIEEPIYDGNENVIEYIYVDDLEESVEEIFVHVSQMPQFPGGIPALKKWVAKHIEYPSITRENGIEGTVYLRFEVTKTGTIGKIEIQKSVDNLLDREAIEVVRKLPKFKPGKHNGANVNVWFSIPISFMLN